MKKPYQIESQRAVRRLEEMAADGNPAVQMVLPLAEMVGWLRQRVGALIRQAGLRLMELLMEEEVREVVGERSRPQPDRTANRWGKERGYCVVMGQKVPIERPHPRLSRRPPVAGASRRSVGRTRPRPGPAAQPRSAQKQTAARCTLSRAVPPCVPKSATLSCGRSGG
jgi:hypothetical protein